MRFLIVLSIIILTGCASSQPNKKYVAINKLNKNTIIMQRVADSDPLEKQKLVNRNAMQVAVMDQLNLKEEELSRKFLQNSKQQRDDFLQKQKEQDEEFLKANQRHTDTLFAISHDIALSAKEIGNSVEDMTELKSHFTMIASDLESSNLKQNTYFNDMRKSYENKLAFEQAKLQEEKDRENTIRGVVDNMYKDQESAFKKLYQASKEGMLPPTQWVDLEEAKVSIHVDDEKFEDLMERALTKASVYSGPWNLKWKLRKENEIILYTKFSLDAETSFNDFVSNVKKYIVNYNGVTLFFRVFKEKRILIVSDS